MKGVIYLLLLGIVIGNSVGEAELPLGQPCDPEACQLPDCRCSTTDIPGGLDPRDTPQVKKYFIILCNKQHLIFVQIFLFVAIPRKN